MQHSAKKRPRQGDFKDAEDEGMLIIDKCTTLLIKNKVQFFCTNTGTNIDAGIAQSVERSWDSSVGRVQIPLAVILPRSANGKYCCGLYEK